MPDRLAPTGGSLHRGTIILLGLLHRTAMIVRKKIRVKELNTEKTIRNGTGRRLTSGREVV
jgi:hypothetical protein